MLRTRLGAMLVSTGILSRMLALQIYSEKGFEITPEQYLVLSLIVDYGGELYQRQISEITFKDRSNVTRIINILESKGLVKRVKDTNKRMIYKIAVTAKGIETREKIKPTAMEIKALTTKGIADKDIEFTLEILEKMQLNMWDKVALHT